MANFNFQYSPQEIIILQHLTGLTSTQIWLEDWQLSVKQQREFFKKQQLLEQNLPLDYILGQVWCQGLRLNIDKNVLIPRPETEFWLQKLIENIKIDYKLKNKTEFEKLSRKNLNSKIETGQNLTNNSKTLVLVEIGTGSGLIALTLAQKFKFAKIVATDLSLKALRVAQQNADQNKIKNVKFIQADLLNFELDFLVGLNWILIANLPYLPLRDKIEATQNKVEFEPSLALYSGKSGLKHFNKLLRQLKNLVSINSQHIEKTVSAKISSPFDSTKTKVADTNLSKNKISLPNQIYLELDPRNIRPAQQKLDQLYQKYLRNLDCVSENQQHSGASNSQLAWHSQIWLDENGLERVLVGQIIQNKF